MIIARVSPSSLRFSIARESSINNSKDKEFLFSGRAERILGLKSSEVIGRPLHSIFPDVKLNEENGDFIPKINQLWKYRNKLVVFSSVPIRADGRYFGQVTVLQDNETIRNAEEKIRRDQHHKRFLAQYTFKDIAGSSALISNAMEKAKIFAKSDSAVLILGETGTGKELFAQSIHTFSRRRSQPFVSINCGALPESLLDSELFGYDKGSFTGARSEGKIGLFEMAHKGTIFLDEVGEILPSVQVRLLRVIQEKEVMRVGGTV
ncbi:MAG: AAA family ATPase [Desulfobacteraceae bacterium]|nr:MAG: AAA family ATPase [Desulfobacteraceae bacterium]